MIELYPLTFKTIFKDKIWGGNKIKTHLGKDYGALPNCGETWEISAVAGNVSIINNGALANQKLDEVIAASPENWMGKSVVSRFGEEFPLLIKFLDAAEDLSVQVHPDDVMAEKLHKGKGKTEMWYIMEHESKATLIDGFSRDLTADEYVRVLEGGEIMNVLNRVSVEKGDVFYIPAGRVHTIGKGIMLAEIQQTSDITYRIYDFDRVDNKGNLRELHTELALKALDFRYVAEVKTPYVKNQKNTVTDIVKSPFFVTNKLLFDKESTRDLQGLDSFKIYICLDGDLEISNGSVSTNLKKGDCALVPASWKGYQLNTKGGFEALETFIA